MLTTVIQPAFELIAPNNRLNFRWLGAELVVVVADVLIAMSLGSIYQHQVDRKSITSDVSRTRDYHMVAVVSMENEVLEARTRFRDRIDMLELERPTILNQAATSSFRDIGTRSPQPQRNSRTLGDGPTPCGFRAS